MLIGRRKIIVINYATDGSDGTKDLVGKAQEQSRQIRRFNVDEVINYTPEKIKDTDFYRAHRETLTKPRGGGLWLWKPYIILQTLNSMETNDLLVYVDCDIDVRRNLVFFASEAERKGFTAISSPFLNWTYTKRECLVALDADQEPYLTIPQIWAAVLAFQNSPETRQFVLEWLLACTNPKCLWDENISGIPEYDGFTAHRHDQSVLTVMALRRGFPILDNAHSEDYGHPPG